MPIWRLIGHWATEKQDCIQVKYPSAATEPYKNTTLLQKLQQLKKK